MRVAIINIDGELLRDLLKLPKEAKILRVQQLERAKFEIPENGAPTLQVMFEWEGLPYEIRKNEVAPFYRAMIDESGQMRFLY